MMHGYMCKGIETTISSSRIRKFTELTQRLLNLSSLLAGEEVHLLINPISGKLRRCRTHRRMMRKLRRLVDIHASANRRAIHESGGIAEYGNSVGNRTDTTDKMEMRGSKASPKFYFHETSSPHKACNLALKIVRSLTNLHDERLRLLILAGGDGFHRDICSVLIQQAPRLLQNIILFRLPMGTGNDSADAETLEEALFMLSNTRTTKKDSVIEIRTNLDVIHHACNTVCFGIDAFVCLLTNKMKKLVGAAFIYRFFANVAVLFYEIFSPLREWSITVFKPDGGIEKRRGRYLLNIFGRKGNTTYGGGMKVLPDKENYLLAQPLSLLEKIELKPLFYRGAHRHLPTIEFFLSDRVTMKYDGSILMALDGEVVPLRPEDFPLELRKIPDVLTVLH